MRHKDPSCPLCFPKRLTEWVYVDPEGMFVIMYCLTCRVPMLNFLFHEEPTEEEWEQAKAKARQLSPGCGFRMERRKLPLHPHCHIIRGNYER